MLPAGRVPLISATSIEYIFKEFGSTFRIIYFGEVGNIPGYTPDVGEERSNNTFHSSPQYIIKKSANGMFTTSLSKQDTLLKHPKIHSRITNIQQILNRYPDVIQFNSLFQKYNASEGISYNRIQFSMHARASRFISVAGGSAIVASYFGGVNVIMTAHSVPENAIGGFYSRFAGTRIVAVSTNDELMMKVKEEYDMYGGGNVDDNNLYRRYA